MTELKAILACALTVFGIARGRLFHNTDYLILDKSFELLDKIGFYFAPNGVKLTGRLVPHIETSNSVTFMLRPRAHASRAQSAAPRKQSRLEWKQASAAG
ncbi:hypothetical protein [Rhizobium leguminosarum]|uniref:hypothetical protein n=1 Tax=Rhizobium leguminosarum TaxID=384 RepID=UPI001441F774|nr:hypothetical protein [Rhizobium leguminosarum]NKJ82650.1 hypothetical protein [Rhizobium leguminosarum bv. viciae]